MVFLSWHLWGVLYWLVVEPTPLKHMSSSVGMMTFPTEWKNKIHVPNHQPVWFFPSNTGMLPLYDVCILYNEKTMENDDDSLCVSDKSKITETKMESFEADCTIDRSVFLLAWPPIFCFFLCWYGYGSKLTGWDLRHLLSRGSKVLLGTKCLGDLRGEMVWQVQATRKGVVVTYTNKDWTTWNGYSD